MSETRFYVTDSKIIINIDKITYMFKEVERTSSKKEYVGIYFTGDDNYINLYEAEGDKFWDFIMTRYFKEI